MVGLAFLVGLIVGGLLVVTVATWAGKRRRGLSPDWQPPRRNPEPSFANWDNIRDAASRGDFTALAEYESCEPCDLGRK